MDACGLGVLCCLRRFRQPRENHTRELPQVQLDTGNMGKYFILPTRLTLVPAVFFLRRFALHLSHFVALLLENLWLPGYTRLSHVEYFLFIFFYFSRFFALSGNEVVIVKSGKRICGSGAALANAPILQNKCYFESKIQSGGNVSFVVSV